MNYILDFTGKSVLITGGASGIGLECAKAFLQNNATVYLTDYNEEALSKAVAELREAFPDGKVFSAVCDITNEESVAALPSFIKENTGSLDILLNNAGTGHSVYSINEEKKDWDKVISLNLTSHFFVSQLMAKEFFIPQKKGKIVNMASLSALMGVPAACAYSASKGAVLQMTKSLACEWARFGITVNCVCPGFVETPLIADNLADERWMTYMNMRTPMRRLAKTQDVAGSVLFLSSSLSDFITGTSIVVDGGFSSGS